MLLVLVQTLGVLVFVVGTVWLRRRLNREPTVRMAERTSRMSHVLFHLGLFWPFFVTAWLTFARFEDPLGLPPLPLRHVAFAAGAVLLSVGVSLALLSFKELGMRGRGAPSFLLAKEVVTDGLYQRSRNPLALGWYLFCLGGSVMAGSTYLMLHTLLLLVPAHVFYLKHFEEFELEIRFGAPYRQYKQSVPFLLPRFRSHSNATRLDTWAARARRRL